MKFGKLKRAVAVFLIAITASSSLMAHSGRTDSSGGHKDNKNKSGLGSYHYHCGGYPAHLHTKGVCPYKTSASNDTTVKYSTTTNTTSKYLGSQNITSKPTYVEKDQNFVIDGKNVKISTIAIDNTNLVELKTLCKELDISMSYDSSIKTIECTKGTTSFKLQIGSTSFWLNDTKSTLNIAPIVYNDRTMVPVRVIAEAIGKVVEYDSSNNSIVIN